MQLDVDMLNLLSEHKFNKKISAVVLSSIGLFSALADWRNLLFLNQNLKSKTRFSYDKNSPCYFRWKSLSP